ncbi:MAG: uroporphyrinogen decarboxylase [Rhodospirillales bacterium CG15_BIG_FIL_POST_REV_8_21_14_020_66_15]|nr:MAG: uroporphyrinogen decarboxylase [Rhodospirillales bacterium CG15_BIG_FIL_POST_REV_8_21_14_020_66_15]
MRPFLEPFLGKTPNRPPAWFMRQAGRYLPEYRELRAQAPDFLKFCYSPDLTVEATLQPIRRFGFDAAILFSDILVIPDALGQQVRFEEGVGPLLDPIGDRLGIAALRAGSVLDRLAPVFETLRRLRRELPDDTALIGFAGAPWTLAFYMIEGRGGVDGGKLKRMAYGSPGDFAALMTVLEDALVAYLCRQVESGAEVLQLFDSWSGIADETLFARWVIAPTKRIVARVKEVHPTVPIIGFPRGAGPMVIDYAAATGVDGVSVDSQVPLSWARRNVPAHMVLQGNLDNQLLVAGGDDLDAAVARIVRDMRGHPFVFNLGHGILPQTPPDNVARVLNRLRGGAGES